MSPPELHFSRDEHDQRLQRARVRLAERDLAGIIVFAQESHFYLTGYDSVGYVFFQCGVLTADGQPYTLLTRRPDVQQAREGSIIEDVRVWYDAEGANPAEDLKAILAEKGLQGQRVGIELGTHGLTGLNAERVRLSLDGWCSLEDASDLVRNLRLVKSAAEIAYVRRAAALADAALLVMIEAARPHVLESTITAAGLNVILAGGGDVPPSGPLVNSGRRALYGRSVAGPRVLDEVDQVTIEFAATYHRYNACIMRTVAVGEVRPLQREMFVLTRAAIDEMTRAAAPGRPLGEIDDAHRRVFDEAGHEIHRFAACGYSLGATYRPTWMDVPPMLYSGNPLCAQAGMVLFLHAMFPNTKAGLAMSLGHTILITEDGREVLSKLPLEMPVAAW